MAERNYNGAPASECKNVDDKFAAKIAKKDLHILIIGSKLKELCQL